MVSQDLHGHERVKSKKWRAVLPGMFTLVVAAVGGLLAGIVLATYFERSRSATERAGFEKSSKTLFDQLADTRAQLDQARSEDAAQKATIARLEERHAATERETEQMRVTLPHVVTSLHRDVLGAES